MTEQPPLYAETVDERVGTAVAEEPAVDLAGRPVRHVAVPAATVAPVGVASATRNVTYVGSPSYRPVQIVWFICGLVETVIGMRVIFTALAANPDAGLVQFIDDLAAPFVAPFRGIFRDVTLSGAGVLETGSLVAMVVYAVVAALVVRLVRILITPSRPIAA